MSKKAVTLQSQILQILLLSSTDGVASVTKDINMRKVLRNNIITKHYYYFAFTENPAKFKEINSK